MYQNYNIDNNNNEISLTKDLVITDINSGEFCRDNYDQYTSNGTIIAYIPKKIYSNSYNDYSKNKKLLFESNIKSILKLDINKFNYRELFIIYLHHINKTFEISMTDKVDYYIYYNDDNSVMCRKYFTCNNELLLTDDNRCKYIELFTISNKIFEKIKTPQIIYNLQYSQYNNTFINNNYFCEYIYNNLENILENTKKKIIVTVGEHKILPKIKNWLEEDKTDYSKDEKISINILYDIKNFMGLHLLKDKEYISILKLSSEEIKKINDFIEYINKAADEFVC